MSGSAAQLYEEDFVRWTEEQSSALRDAAGVGTNLPLDWENLAEEIESLGRSQRYELRSRLAVILEHLIKLEHSLAIDPRVTRLATASFFGYGEVNTLPPPSYTEDQVIGGWFPGENPLPACGEREGPAVTGPD
jgi:hypothetical protein